MIDKVKLCDSVETNDLIARSWLSDILDCVNAVSSQYFTLSDVYKFEKHLAILHPENNNIQAKIRQ